MFSLSGFISRILEFFFKVRSPLAYIISKVCKYRYKIDFERHTGNKSKKIQK